MLPFATAVATLVYHSSYPHGGWVLTGLMACCITALSCTLYGVGSCRFVYVDFMSDRGDFNEFYLDPTADGDVVKYRAGVGLFTWLLPFDETDWSQGQCTGYTALQQEIFADNTFEVARIFGVLSVLCGVGVTAWTLFLSCLSLGKYQIWAMSATLFLLTFFVGFSFLLVQSNLCQDLVSYQDASYTTECSMDQGGLVTIASAILWCVAFLISVIYIKPPERDMMFLPNGEITNAFQQRQLDRARQKRDKQRMQQKLAEQLRAQTNPIPSRSRPESASSPMEVTLTTNSRSSNSDIYGEGETEVQLGSQRGNHRGFHGPSNIHIEGEI